MQRGGRPGPASASRARTKVRRIEPARPPHAIGGPPAVRSPKALGENLAGWRPGRGLRAETGRARPDRVRADREERTPPRAPRLAGAHEHPGSDRAHRTARIDPRPSHGRPTAAGSRPEARTPGRGSMAPVRRGVDHRSSARLPHQAPIGEGPRDRDPGRTGRLERGAAASARRPIVDPPSGSINGPNRRTKAGPARPPSAARSRSTGARGRPTGARRRPTGGPDPGCRGVEPFPGIARRRRTVAGHPIVAGRPTGDGCRTGPPSRAGARRRPSPTT